MGDAASTAAFAPPTAIGECSACAPLGRFSRQFPCAPRAVTLNGKVISWAPLRFRAHCRPLPLSGGVRVGLGR